MNISEMYKLNSRIYRCPDDIQEFQFRITLNKHDSLSTNIEDNSIIESEIKNVCWQEKLFSRTEIDMYSDRFKCLTEHENYYHNLLVSSTQIPGRIFTYTIKDNFIPNDEKLMPEIQNKITTLNKEISKLKIEEPIKVSKPAISKYDINMFLSDSIVNPFIAHDYETMYVMADLGDRDRSRNWIKFEHILYVIKYDSFNKFLFIYPDFSRSKHDLHNIEVEIQKKVHFSYRLEHISKQKDEEIDFLENQIIYNINLRNLAMKSRIFRSDFSVPPNKIIRFYIFFEILTARDFEYDNIFIRYILDLPNNWYTIDSVYGTTQTSKVSKNNVANFGHCFEFMIDYKMDENEPPSFPIIYFHVISKDVWHRFRTEGLAYKFLPVFKPGMHNFTMHCLRLYSESSIVQLRRFFTGDFCNFKKFSWFGVRNYYKSNTINKYGVDTIGTGTIEVRCNIIKQCNHESIDLTYKNTFNENSDYLVNSVKEVINAFRRARKKMIHARNNLLHVE